MHIRRDGTFFAGLGGTPLFVAPNIRPVKRVGNGRGDLTLGASYLLPGRERRSFDLKLTGRVKIPTASKASQLSTGKTDSSGGVSYPKTSAVSCPPYPRPTACLATLAPGNSTTAST
jgi:hypothetical protein